MNECMYKYNFLTLFQAQNKNIYTYLYTYTQDHGRLRYVIGQLTPSLSSPLPFNSHLPSPHLPPPLSRILIGPGIHNLSFSGKPGSWEGGGGEEGGREWGEVD